ncbi:MAG: pyridoxal-phosphate dependent enzyme [Phycisphaerales bacterium]|nr:pyridoxal-phosphate dependent enzyme [Phycisphaerales bacterium]MCI0629901.1 pyridoxal-phosphate dependent enzyme [Phycisphaerales bacterium]MCI0674996.1 pyridoxal-phosphate dependent enzyme [Phycisphaerales bacterium]
MAGWVQKSNKKSTEGSPQGNAATARESRLDHAAVPHPTTPPVHHNVLEMIGATPMLELRKMDAGKCRLFVKMESANPGNSIKDRIAVSMVEQAERDGRLVPGKGHIIEATAGNTGIALALVAGQKGYKLTVVMPDKMSSEKISHLRAMGAQVRLTRSDVEKGHPEYYQDMAERLARETPNSLYVNQFGNKANPKAHYETTGPEIWRQMEGEVDAFVAGVGSGGTMTGVGQYLRERNPKVELILADPAGSVLAPLINCGQKVPAGSWLVEGMGEDFVPEILNLDQINRGITISDGESFTTARELLKEEGILVGSSTGCLVAAALRYCREQKQPKRVVSLVCDHGAKYLSKMFNDFWMIDNGFIERETFGDLRDLIARRHLAREDYTLKPATPLAQAVKSMHMYDVSQMAVVDENDRVIGIIDESDVLLALTHDGDQVNRPVSDFMTRRLETIKPTASVNDLMPIFRADRVAIVADENHFYGLITKIDLITYLRKRLK